MIDDSHTTTWGNRFIITAIIQGGVLTLLALLLVGLQFISANEINMIQYLSLSFDGAGKWFFLGTIFYLILIVAIAVTAIFYIHLEINLKRRISNSFLVVLAWIHLIGMNTGGPMTTILMIYAGLSGTGLLSVFVTGKIGEVNVEILDTLITPIAFSIGILGISVFCGGLTYILTYIKNNKKP